MIEPVTENVQKEKQNKKGFSIRRFLTLFLLVAIGINTVVSSIWVYRDAAHEVEELFDASLAQTARVLHGMITRENIAENKEHLLASLSNKDEDLDLYSYEATPHGHKYEKKVSFQVWSDEKELLLYSVNIGKNPLTSLERGFSESQTAEGHWRTFTLYSEADKYWLIVGERDDIREELTHDIARDHMVPVILCLPLLGLLIWLSLGKGFRPLNRISQQVESQDYETLSKIEFSDIPNEVSGLISSINGLFSRLNQSYRREQRFVSDAAHELRNPLAGVLVHTENMLRDYQQGQHNGDLTEPLFHIKRSTQRLSRLVSQLLELSRADPEHFTLDDQTVDLGLMMSEVCHEFALIGSKELICEVELGLFKLPGNQSLLESLLRNLVDNALRYSPESSKVVVRCEKTENAIKMLVEDSGKGINESDREAVLLRFHRGREVTASGSGLGLAIVSQVAALHDAKIELRNSSLGGLLVEITFHTPRKLT